MADFNWSELRDHALAEWANQSSQIEETVQKMNALVDMLAACDDALKTLTPLSHKEPFNKVINLRNRLRKRGLEQ